MKDMRLTAKSAVYWEPMATIRPGLKRGQKPPRPRPLGWHEEPHPLAITTDEDDEDVAGPGDIPLLASDISFVVFRLKGRPGKFTLVKRNSEPLGVSLHSGEFTEREVRELLANREQLPAPQIEVLMQLAQEAPEFNAPPFIRRINVIRTR